MSFCICFSPPIVGAYRIRPDEGELEMTAASILSLKVCRGTQQGFYVPGSVAAERSEVFTSLEVLPRNAARFLRSWKCCRGTQQGFYALGNVAAERSEVFTSLEVLPRSAARFPHDMDMIIHLP